VIDLLDEGKSQAHSLTPFAKVDGLRVTYPGESNS
jgi:hypothetical protein